MNKDRFGNPIHDGDIVFYVTNSQYTNERIGKVFFQKQGELGMMADYCRTGGDMPPGSQDRQYFDQYFKPERRWYSSSSVIVVTPLVPQAMMDKFDIAYDNWRKKHGNKEF